MRRAASTSCSPAKPPRPRPVSTSSSTSSGELRAADGRQQLVEERPVAGRDGDPLPRRLGGPGGRDRIEHEDRARDAALAELERLVERRDAEPFDAGGLERPCDGNRPVAVGVGLDHRPDRHAGTGQLPERLQVAAQRVEVDLEPGRPRERRKTGRGKTRLDRRSLPGRRAHERVVSLSGFAPARPAPARPMAIRPARRDRARQSPRRLPLPFRSAMAASRLRAIASPSGRSDARRPASPKRSRTPSPATPWR